jgi:disulfide bond formation protein DsbB
MSFCCLRRRFAIFSLILCILLSLCINLLTTSSGDSTTASTGGNVYGDFDNDGYDDLAIGVPGEGIGTADAAGAVNVLYGSSGGLSAVGDQLWHQNSPGILGICEGGDEFGYTLSVGDFDNDGYDDLAIGVPYEGIGTAILSGAVNVLYGSSSGLSSAGNQLWHQNSPGILGKCEYADLFGFALSVGDFDNDGYDDLAIGVLWEGIGTADAAGAVNVLYGSLTGLSSTGNQLWHQNSPGILGICEYGDEFGSALSVGDFDNDGYDDLAIGVPSEGIGTADYAGAVNIIYGSSSGLSSVGDQLWHQNSPIILGICETDDDFGFALSVGDFDNDGYDDLAIGVRQEGIGTADNAGAVNVLYGSSTGLCTSGNQLWHQNSPGILGLSESGDRFGWSLSVGDFDNDGYDDLAIGAPKEGIGTNTQTGAVNVLYGSSGGLSSVNDQLWHQNSPGILGLSEISDRFGWALSVGDFDNDGYDDLAIGVPWEGIGTVNSVGAVNVLYGSSSGLSASGDQLWHQNSPGILGKCEYPDKFGYS